jgi:plasmid maintenance system antidote protein VapI
VCLVETPADSSFVHSGRTLKSIVDQTNTHIHIPPREPTDPSSPPLDNAQDEAEDPLIPITIAGASTSIDVARDLIQAIVAERTSKTAVKIGAAEISREYWPLLRKQLDATILAQADATDVDVRIPRWTGADREHAVGDDDVVDVEKKERAEPTISVAGEREAVARVVAALQDKYEELVRWPFVLDLPKCGYLNAYRESPETRHAHSSDIAAQTPTPLPRRFQR